MKVTSLRATRVLLRFSLVLVLIVLPSSSGMPAAVAGAAAVYTVNAADDANDGTCNPSHCSLREAILAANASPGLDTITFNIPGGGAHTIQPDTNLPELSDSVIIDGYTQAGAAANTNPTSTGSNAQLRIQLDGADKYDLTGLKMYANDSTVRGLAISRFSSYGIQVAGSGNKIEGSFLGTDVTGTAHLPNGANDIRMDGASNAVIGGTEPAARNVIADSLLIIYEPAMGNRVVGNLVGLDATGMATLGNGGIKLMYASFNTIGGTEPAARNVICGGIKLVSTANNNQIMGNYIGTLVNGTAKCAGETGIDISSSGNMIGGPLAGAGNVIAGQGTGIVFAWGEDNRVQGNYIGTDATGAAALGNGTGVRIMYGTPGVSRGNKIGGLTAIERNIISGNADGVVIESGAVYNRVFGNYIGTDITGLLPLPNSGDAVIIAGASNNAIGGPEPGAGNVIAYNKGNGVWMPFSLDTVGNQIRGNGIYSNEGLGIDLGTPSSPGPSDGVTPNDPLDADDGPNRLLNYPVLTSIERSTETTVTGRLESAANSMFEIQFFANPSCGSYGFGEGQTLLGSGLFLTNGAGVAEFTQVFTQTLAPAAGVSATTTDAAGNTSEFSFCLVRNLYLPLALRDK